MGRSWANTKCRGPERLKVRAEKAQGESRVEVSRGATSTAGERPRPPAA